MVLLDLCRSSRIVETGLPKPIEHFTRSDHEIRLHVGQMTQWLLVLLESRFLHAGLREERCELGRPAVAGNMSMT